MGRRGEGIEVLERLNKLTKTIAGPEMDLENLKRIKKFVCNAERERDIIR